MKINKNYYSSLLARSGIASLDQIILSGLNFAISILLIKNVAKVEFGYYSIAFPISLFLISIQNAIVNTPVAVLLPGKFESEQGKYTTSLWYGQLIVMLPAITAGFVVIAFLKNWGIESTKIYVSAAVCFAAGGILLREFLRAYYFSHEKPIKVLKIDIYYVSLISVLAILSYIYHRISVPGIFVIIGISGLTIGLTFLRIKSSKFDRQYIRKSYSENWKYGKWSLLGVIVTHIQTYSYLYLLGLMIDSVAVAEVSAARLLLMPLILVSTGWSKIVLPHGSRLRESNQLYKFYKEQIISIIIYLFVVAAYVIALFSFSGIIQDVIFSEKYANSFNYTLILAAIFSVGFISHNASWGLQVIKKFDIISKVIFITMIVTLGSAIILIHLQGIKGGLRALLIGNCLMASVLWYYFRKAIVATRAHKFQQDSNRSKIKVYRQSEL